jgi:3-methyladenine DNA glycosylase Mpg
MTVQKVCKRVKASKEPSSVSVLVRAVAVAQKLSMAEERLQEQNCLIQTGDHRNKGHISEKLTRVKFPRKMFYVD